jgi:hypothetical protein
MGACESGILEARDLLHPELAETVSRSNIKMII